ncbi:LytTR family transcriptional regulator DNA-binding domain-containing protein [Mucilaginibacter ginsenosidivorax]
MRVHRSYIISINHISAYTGSYIEIGRQSIPIGNSYAKDVLGKLEG